MQNPNRGVVVAVSQVLPADVRHHLRALADDKLLRIAHTGYAYRSRGWLERTGRSVDRFFGTQLTGSLARRPEIAGVSTAEIRTKWLAEAAGMVLLRGRGGPNTNSAYHDWLQTRLSIAAAKDLRDSDKVVVAREFDAKEVFERAAKSGLVRVYQLPTAHYATVNRIVLRELEQFPDADLRQSHAWSVSRPRIARKNAELALASHVLVPSLFVKQSLLDAGVSKDTVQVLPFGTESNWINDALPPKNPNLFLHVGQLSIRKGTHRLLRAWKELGAYRTCELRLIGSMQLSPQFLAQYQGMFNYVGRIPRQALRQHFASASCFILPALAEGFAVVILESLSCGTPVVASRNSGAEGFIREGEEGLLHDAQDDEQLCQALESMLARPQSSQEMAERCLEKARNWTWDHYRTQFTGYIRRLMNENGKIN
jgi:glycosyltransferase involved in cell wall biosynthesis